MFMPTVPTRMLSIAVGFTIGYLLMNTASFASESDCKAILDAEHKVYNAPAHIYATTTMGGHPQTSEMIYAAGNIYSKTSGRWQSIGTIEEIEELTQSNHPANKPVCHYVKDESVNGETTALYSSHEETSKGKVDTQTWISKSKGLPLRQEINIDVGGSSGKTVNSTRYEYDNVKAPM